MVEWGSNVPWRTHQDTVWTTCPWHDIWSDHQQSYCHIQVSLPPYSCNILSPHSHHPITAISSLAQPHHPFQQCLLLLPNSRTCHDADTHHNDASKLPSVPCSPICYLLGRAPCKIDIKTLWRLCIVAIEGAMWADRQDIVDKGMKFWYVETFAYAKIHKYGLVFMYC